MVVVKQHFTRILFSIINTSPRTIQKFFHAWTKQNGLWKLSTKKHE